MSNKPSVEPGIGYNGKWGAAIWEVKIRHVLPNYSGADTDDPDTALQGAILEAFNL